MGGFGEEGAVGGEAVAVELVEEVSNVGGEVWGVGAFRHCWRRRGGVDIVDFEVAEWGR